MFSVGDSPVAIVFQFEDEAGMIKGAWHGCKGTGGNSLSFISLSLLRAGAAIVNTDITLQRRASNGNRSLTSVPGWKGSVEGLWEGHPDLLSARQESRL